MSSSIDDPQRTPDFDVYEGMSWTERAAYGIYGVALDHADSGGKKNRFMDLVHQLALSRALRDSRRRFERALDFGCGGGRLLPLLTQHAREVYGVDRTPACLELARSQAAIPAQQLVCWRGGELPFPGGFFDLVLCVYVLLTSAALDTLAAEIGRVCASGGYAFVLEQADNSRGLTVAHYRTAFTAAGFACERAIAVRRSSGSRAMKLATRSWTPPWVGTLAARWELELMKRAEYGPQTAGYYDYLFVFRKLGEGQLTDDFRGNAAH